ncbi:hypothetical protein BT63DRAFT_438016 [Microthyrium microscopicum]|uniref:Uncharacterized protein n=1 Tax=Microthyrium microscopicum TaxID=703497 RepID=A0A6A6UL16_9PEZI|nr:hypothetical protein BT63DRAFT_438016 [Microthyrium microscopicum]
MSASEGRTLSKSNAQVRYDEHREAVEWRKVKRSLHIQACNPPNAREPVERLVHTAEEELEWRAQWLADQSDTESVTSNYFVDDDGYEIMTGFHQSTGLDREGFSIDNINVNGINRVGEPTIEYLLRPLDPLKEIARDTSPSIYFCRQAPETEVERVEPGPSDRFASRALWRHNPTQFATLPSWETENPVADAGAENKHDAEIESVPVIAAAGKALFNLPVAQAVFEGLKAINIDDIEKYFWAPIPEEMLNWRFIDKNITYATRIQFAETFFKSRSLTLTQTSIQTLVEISNHPLFSQHVKKLVLCLLPFDKPTFPGEDVFSTYRRHKEEDILRSKCQSWQDITTSWSPMQREGLLSLLRSTIMKFPNLKHVQILESRSCSTNSTSSRYDLDDEYIAPTEDQDWANDETNGINQAAKMTSLQMFALMLSVLPPGHIQTFSVKMDSMDLLEWREIEQHLRLDPFLLKVQEVNYSHTQGPYDRFQGFEYFFIPLLYSNIRLRKLKIENIKSHMVGAGRGRWDAANWVETDFEVPAHIDEIEFSNCLLSKQIMASWIQALSRAHPSRIIINNVTLGTYWMDLLKNWVWSPILELRGTLQYTSRYWGERQRWCKRGRNGCVVMKEIRNIDPSGMCTVIVDSLDD